MDWDTMLMGLTGVFTVHLMKSTPRGDVLFNFSKSREGNDQPLNDQCQSPFMGKYKFGLDAMASGEPLCGSNRLNMYTPNSSKIIQGFLEKKAIWDPTSSTGFRKHDYASREMKEVDNPNTSNQFRLFRVPVTTIIWDTTIPILTVPWKVTWCVWVPFQR